MKALITGASSGIGREMARYLAEQGWDLIVAARSTGKLEALRQELSGVNVRVITIDLSREQDAYDLFEHLQEEQIDFLINNAGFGAYGLFEDVPLETEMDLIHTNVCSVHILTKLFLGDMLSRGGGMILNVGSMAVRRKGGNVKISVLCPGPVDTNFNNTANVSFPMKGLDPKFVARYAIDKTMKGKMLIVPGFTMKAAKFFSHFLSEKALTRLSYGTQSKKSGN